MTRPLSVPVAEREDTPARLAVTRWGADDTDGCPTVEWQIVAEAREGTQAARVLARVNRVLVVYRAVRDRLIEKVPGATDVSFFHGTTSRPRPRLRIVRGER